MFPDPRCHLETGRLQTIRREPGGTPLLHRQLRMAVDVLVERLEVVEHPSDAVEDRPTRARDCHDYPLVPVVPTHGSLELTVVTHYAADSH